MDGDEKMNLITHHLSLYLKYLFQSFYLFSLIFKINSVYDPKVTRDQMFIEFDYTTGLTPSSFDNLESFVETAGLIYFII